MKFLQKESTPSRLHMCETDEKAANKKLKYAAKKVQILDFTRAKQKKEAENVKDEIIREKKYNFSTLHAQNSYETN